VSQPEAPLLAVSDLVLDGPAGPLVHGISFAIARGGALGIVGESGSGKTLTCRSLLGILPPGVHVTGGSIDFEGRDLTRIGDREWQGLRGAHISAVFQDPGSYLNPSIPVGKQLVEVLRVKSRLRRRDATARAIELLGSMGLRSPELVYWQYPHELSGGMLQRVLIAIAVCENPQLLVADEATTALDVTVQAEVLDVLADLRAKRGLALVLVSHDLAVVAQVCDEIIVVQHGNIVEAGSSQQVLRAPRHEYTRQLVRDHARYGLEKHLAAEFVDA
jgi:peptide/nickel transport system ATP-binding protein